MTFKCTANTVIDIKFADGRHQYGTCTSEYRTGIANNISEYRSARQLCPPYSHPKVSRNGCTCDYPMIVRGGAGSFFCGPADLMGLDLWAGDGITKLAEGKNNNRLANWTCPSTGSYFVQVSGSVLKEVVLNGVPQTVPIGARFATVSMSISSVGDVATFAHALDTSGVPVRVDS